jgi:hypothetical protein
LHLCLLDIKTPDQSVFDPKYVPDHLIGEKIPFAPVETLYANPAEEQGAILDGCRIGRYYEPTYRLPD